MQISKKKCVLKTLSINIPFVKASFQMSSYETFMKELVTKKRSRDFEMVKYVIVVVPSSQECGYHESYSGNIYFSMYYWDTSILPKLYVIWGHVTWCHMWISNNMDWANLNPQQCVISWMIDLLSIPLIHIIIFW